MTQKIVQPDCPPCMLRGVPYITWEDGSKMEKEAEVRPAWDITWSHQEVVVMIL